MVSCTVLITEQQRFGLLVNRKWSPEICEGRGSYPAWMILVHEDQDSDKKCLSLEMVYNLKMEYTCLLKLKLSYLVTLLPK